MVVVLVKREEESIFLIVNSRGVRGKLLLKPWNLAAIWLTSLGFETRFDLIRTAELSRSVSRVFKPIAFIFSSGSGFHQRQSVSIWPI